MFLFSIREAFSNDSKFIAVDIDMTGVRVDTQTFYGMLIDVWESLQTDTSLGSWIDRIVEVNVINFERVCKNSNSDILVFLREYWSMKKAYRWSGDIYPDTKEI